MGMIDWVSCSKNGNSIPPDSTPLTLIPRWSDRLEAVGKEGVVRCYQYTIEHGRPLSSALSPRPRSVDELWALATPERFEHYQLHGPTFDDMISHFYDKLLHVARPPNVGNAYLQAQAEIGIAPLVHVCLEYGRTGQVDVAYMEGLARELLEKQ